MNISDRVEYKKNSLPIHTHGMAGYFFIQNGGVLAGPAGYFF